MRAEARRRRGVGLGVLLSVLSLLSSPATAQAPGPRVIPSLAESIERLEREATGPVHLRRSSHAGVATFLRTNPGRGVASGASAAAPAETRARTFLSAQSDTLGLPDHVRFRTSRISPTDPVGQEHVRLQQTYEGLPIRGAELGVHLRGAEVVAVGGRTLPDPVGLATTPTLAEEAARAAALELLANDYDGAPANLATPRLEIFNAGLLDGRAAPTHLAWFVEATLPDQRLWIWVDAHSGAVLLHFNTLPSARNRMIHDAMDTDNIPGALARSEGQPPVGDSEIDDNYDYTGDTYDYFFQTHGRDSYDGAGADMTSSVRYCSNSALCVVTCPCTNAFWFGTFAVFGALKHDDIVGHEFTHGVIDHTAGLIYFKQSGALNESFADVFGETIDLLNGAGLDTPEVRWLIEEDLLPNTGIRNMMDPTLGLPPGDPGRMTDPQLHCTSDDNFGVHSNSGIPNHAYALMVDGGTYNGQTVMGIGLDKAAKVEYRALTTYLLASSTLQDMHDALQQACADLIGTSGITAGDCVQVKAAADAVEMDLPWQCDCGNGVLDLGEECDDGNKVGRDGCSPVCLIETPAEVPAAGWLGLVPLIVALLAIGWFGIARRT